MNGSRGLFSGVWQHRVGRQCLTGKAEQNLLVGKDTSGKRSRLQGVRLKVFVSRYYMVRRLKHAFYQRWVKVLPNPSQASGP